MSKRAKKIDRLITELDGAYSKYTALRAAHEESDAVFTDQIRSARDNYRKIRDELTALQPNLNAWI